MPLEYTNHWRKKRFKRRQDINDYIIEYCIINSNKIKDRHWPELYNAVYRIPPAGRLLKVVYKNEGKTIK